MFYFLLGLFVGWLIWGINKMANPNWKPNKLSKAEQKIKDAAKKAPKAKPTAKKDKENGGE